VGQRVYILVSDASDIPRAGEVLQQRLWLSDYGRIQVSASGQLLLRTIADGAMFEVNRLDFAGGAICEPPLAQVRGEPDVLPGARWLDTRRALADLSESELERYQALVKSAKQAAAPKRAAAVEAWKKARLESAVHTMEKNGVEKSEAEKHVTENLSRALDGELCGDFLITLHDGSTVSVDEVLADQGKWDGMLTLDPLEPEYRERAVVGKLLLGGPSPWLNSFAHGGRKYKLLRSKQTVRVEKGDLSHCLNQIGAVLASQPDTFLYGKQLVRVADARLILLTKHSLPAFIGRIARVVQIDRHGFERKTDISTAIAEIFGRITCTQVESTYRRLLHPQHRARR